MTHPNHSIRRIQEIGREMTGLAPRTSRDVCRDACAIERPATRSWQGLVYIALAIGAVAVACAIYFN